MRIACVVVATALLATCAAPAGAVPRHESARQAAVAYMRAIADADWREVCQRLSRSARRDLLQTARDGGHATSRCTAAARRVLFPALGRVPIDSVKLSDPRNALVIVGDRRYPDSGGSYRMRLVRGRWLVRDL
jgi:hypothetical protein